MERLTRPTMKVFIIVLVFLLCESVHGAGKGGFLLRNSAAGLNRGENLVSDGVEGKISEGFIAKVFSGWKRGDLGSSSCDETYGLLACTTNARGNLFLLVVYGYIMYLAANCSFYGTETLLAKGPGIIKGSVFHILGAFPVASLVLVSGLFGSTEIAQSQISIGMGLLVGSTVMFLTLLWGSCLVVGKCDFAENSVAVDSQNTRRFSLFGSGISTDESTCTASRIMLASIIPFSILQILQFFHSSSAKLIAVLVAFIAEILCLLSYFIYQVKQPWTQRKQIEYSRDELDNPLPENTKVDNPYKFDLKAVLSENTKVDNPYKFDLKALLLTLGGAVLGGFFAYPFVDAIHNFSDATNIPPFFISFIVMPLATNSSKAFSALIFASCKQKQMASLTYSKIYGAVTMYNTLCFGIFLAIVYIRGLEWDFSAEVLVILVVVFVMGFLGSFRTTFPLWMSFVAFLMYPLTLAIVYVLDFVLGWS